MDRQSDGYGIITFATAVTFGFHVVPYLEVIAIVEIAVKLCHTALPERCKRQRPICCGSRLLFQLWTDFDRRLEEETYLVCCFMCS